MKKEANLITSPVLREFYNTAVQKEWIVEDKLSKSASTSIDKYAATGNFMQDLVNLASGLRELGLYEQAESLEVKLNIFKKAQLAFSNLIDEQSRALQQAAHAESTKIVDAQGGWGVVHTNMDRQQKILETLTHQPGTGSPAPVMNNLVVAAAEALGLLKIAQGEPLTLANSLASSDKTAVSIREVPLNKTQQQTAKEVLDIYTEQAVNPAKDAKTKLQNAISKFKIYASSLNKDLFINQSQVDAQLADFSALANEDSSKITKVHQALVNFGVPFSPERVAQELRSGDYAQVLGKIGTLVSGGLLSTKTRDTYFVGTNILDLSGGSFFDADKGQEREALNNMVQSGKTEYRINTNSIWEGDIGLSDFKILSGTKRKISFDSGPYIRDEQVAAASEAVHKEVMSNLEKYFGSNQKNAIDENLIKIDSILSPILSSLDNITSLAGKTSSSNLIYIKALTDSKNQINSSIASASADANLWSLISTRLEGVSINSDVMSLNKFIEDTIAQIKAKPITFRDMEKTEEQSGFNVIVEDLAHAYDKYANAVQGNYSEEVKAQASTIAQNLASIIEKVKMVQNYGTSDIVVQDILGDQGFKSWQDLKDYADSAATTADADFPEKKAFNLSNKNNLIKSAGPTFGGIGGAKKPSGGSSGAKLTQPVELTETKKAVYNMQWALGKLGDYLMATGDTQQKSDASTIMIIGKTGGAISDPEGVWGANTAKSLKTAKKYVTTISEFGPIKAFNNDQDKIKAAAEKNYELITSFLQGKGFSLTGAPGRVNVVFDKISETLDLTNFNQDGEVPVTQNDLVNLKNFSNFVRSKVNSFPFDIATAEDWQQLIVWFADRATTKVNTAVSLPAKGLARSYLRYVQALSQAFMRKMDSNGIQINTSDWSTLQLKDTLSEGGDLGDQAGGLGAGAGAGAGPGGRVGGAGFGPSSAAGGPGGAGTSQLTYTPGSKRIVPFDARNVYLDSKDPGGSPWFTYVPPGESILSMATVSGNPQNAATMYFPNDTLESFQVLQYFVKYRLIPGTVVTDSATQTYLYKDPRTGAQYNVTDLPAYRNQFEEISQYGSLNSYKQFLTSLLTQLTSAKKSAIDYIQQRGLPEKESDRFIATLDYQHNEWVRAIRRQLSRIQFI